jgi:Flp pilus assembly secretin CpaC
MLRELLSARHASRVIALTSLLVSGLSLTGTASVAQEPITITIDRAKVMRISRPADTIIIGNPAIADATIQDNQTLVITGHSFGSTNLIVLDAAGQAIADEVLMVQSNDDAVVTVFRRSSQVTLSCTPQCAPTLTIGDSGATFESVNEQVGAHNSLAQSFGN